MRKEHSLLGDVVDALMMSHTYVLPRRQKLYTPSTLYETLFCGYSNFDLVAMTFLFRAIRDWFPCLSGVNSALISSVFSYRTNLSMHQGPARKWEEALLNLQVDGASPGQEGDEIAPKAPANVATP